MRSVTFIFVVCLTVFVTGCRTETPEERAQRIEAEIKLAKFQAEQKAADEAARKKAREEEEKTRQETRDKAEKKRKEDLDEANKKKEAEKVAKDKLRKDLNKKEGELANAIAKGKKEYQEIMVELNRFDSLAKVRRLSKWEIFSRQAWQDELDAKEKEWKKKRDVLQDQIDDLRLKLGLALKPRV